MIRILLITLMLAGCGSGGSSNTKEATVEYTPEWGNEVSCLANGRNCSDADVDLNAPVIWAADNGIKIVHIRWAGCSDEEASKYAFDRGVTIICLAGGDGKEIRKNSKYTITVGSSWKGSNYGSGVDYVLLDRGTIHSGIYATALAASGQKLKDWTNDKWYTNGAWHSDDPVLIVDNGFDSVRPLYVLYNNTALAGKTTGDYGIKAINELQRWIDVDVIGYVPFNTLPEEPRIDNWDIK